MDDHEALQALLRERAPREAFSQLALRATPDFEPGSRSRYGDFGFLVLADLISALSGTPYPRYMHEQIFAPLGMADTAFAPTDPERTVPLENAGYPPSEGAYLNALANPAGGLWSTAADLLTFGQTLLGGGEREGYRLLSRAALDTMTHRHTEGLFGERDGRRIPANNGLCWAKRSHAGGILGSERAFGHGGATGTFLWIDPEYGLVFVLLSSRSGSDPGTAIRTLNAVYGAL